MQASRSSGNAVR